MHKSILLGKKLPPPPAPSSNHSVSPRGQDSYEGDAGSVRPFTIFPPLNVFI